MYLGAELQATERKQNNISYMRRDKTNVSRKLIQLIHTEGAFTERNLASILLVTPTPEET